jgi:hypothetical protein
VGGEEFAHVGVHRAADQSAGDPARTRGFIGLWADDFEDLNSRSDLAALFVPLFPTGPDAFAGTVSRRSYRFSDLTLAGQVLTGTGSPYPFVPINW